MGILLVAESEAVDQSAQFGVLLEEVIQLLAANRVDTRIPTLSQGYLVEDIVPGLGGKGKCLSVVINDKNESNVTQLVFLGKAMTNRIGNSWHNGDLRASVSVTNGTWRNTPDSRFTYQWL